MKDFTGKIAVVTGGGSGMGRELVRQLVAEGASVAMCDVSSISMAETKAICEADGVPQGSRITSHLVDVSDEAQVLRFRDEVRRDQASENVHLVINNAGIGGSVSLFTDSREDWDRIFGICWGGVYFMTRAFLPLLVKSDEGHIVNMSSVKGFWASMGPMASHSAYSTAKFAVKGFTEALITDLRINAPHVKCSVAMPGHIGTEMARNSRRVMAGEASEAFTAKEHQRIRVRLAASGTDVANLSDTEIEKMAETQADAFRDTAPTSPAEAAAIILAGVKAERWRILVGEDARRLDEAVRADPEEAYEPAFVVPFTALLVVPGAKAGDDR